VGTALHSIYSVSVKHDQLNDEMPASAYSEGGNELSRHNSLEDQRALQVALELSLLSFGEHGAVSPTSSSSVAQHYSMDHIASLHYADDLRFLAKKSQNMTECVPVPSSEHVAEIVGRQGCKIKALRAKTNTYIKTPVRGEEPVFVVTGRKEDVAAAKREILSAAEHFSQIRASRRSGLVGQGLTGTTGLVPPPPVPGQVTIQVRVPYRVVGLVVGPKGATIKRIQQQTSTYIVTPSREKEPIFEVTGMPDSVDQAKREIEAHIALRTGLLSVDGTATGDLMPDLHQQNSSVSLTNLHNSHLAMNAINGLGLGILGGVGGIGAMGDSSDLMNSLYKTPSALRSAVQAAAASVQGSDAGIGGILGPALGGNGSTLSNYLGDNFGLRASNSVNGLMDFASTNHEVAKSGLDNELQTLGSGLLTSLYDSDEGIGLGGSDSPTLGQSLIQPNIWSTDYGLGPRRSNSFGFPTTSSSGSSTSSTTQGGASSGDSAVGDHPPARRISSDPLTAIGSTLSSLSAAFQMQLHGGDSDSGVRDSSASASGSASPAASPVGSSSNSSTRGSLKRECILCCEGETVAALVPCGHKLFCMDCAQRLVKGESAPNASSGDQVSAAAGGECPVCHQPVTQAIRIFS